MRLLGHAPWRADHRAAQGSVDRTMYRSSTLSSLGDSAALARNRPSLPRAALVEVKVVEESSRAQAPALRLLLHLHCTASSAERVGSDCVTKQWTVTTANSDCGGHCWQVCVALRGVGLPSGTVGRRATLAGRSSSAAAGTVASTGRSRCHRCRPRRCPRSCAACPSPSSASSLARTTSPTCSAR